MRYIPILSLFFLFLCGPAFSQVQTSPGTYSIGGQTDYRVAKIGSFPSTDNTWITLSSDLVTMSSGSGDAWWNADSVKYLYLQRTGDVEMTLKTESLNNLNSWTKLGLMVREGLDPNRKNLFWAIRPSEGSFLQYRTTTGANTVGAWQGHLPVGSLSPTELALKRAIGNLKTPSWVRLVKRGQVFQFFVSEDGKCWDKRHERNMPDLSSAGFYGVALSAGNSSVNAVSTFRNLTIISAPADVNRSCSRATADNWIEPTSWIVPAGKADPNVAWRYITTSPESNSQPTQCTQANLGGEHNRREGPSDPSCLATPAPIQWTQPTFNDNSWSIGNMGFGRTNNPEINENTTWNSGNLWLRKTFNLSSQTEIDNLVIWGKWSQGVSVYLNGVLAYTSYGHTPIHGYASFKPGARGKLVVGTNVIAVRVKAQTWSYNKAQDTYSVQPDYYGFLDMGLTLNNKIVNPQMSVDATPVNEDIARMANGIREMLTLHGVPGAAFAIGEDDQILGAWSYGSRTPQLSATMPSNPILRLASNDKPITRAVIAELIKRDKFKPNGLKPKSKYFAFLNDPDGLNLGIQPPPGIAVGAGMNDFTIDDLMWHRAGTPEVQRGQNLDAMALSMGISPLQWTPEHLVRWIYGLNSTGGHYSSSGHFLLRFLAVKMLEKEGRTLESFLEDEMGLPGIKVSRKDWSARGQLQAGYVMPDFSHTNIWLDDFYSLSASAEAYLNYSFNYFSEYHADAAGNEYVGEPAGHGGAMEGTMSNYSVWSADNKERTLILNMTKSGTGDPNINQYLHELTGKTECDWGNFANPTLAADYYYMRNLWKPDQYFHLEASGFSSRSFATRPPFSGLWYFEPAAANQFFIRTQGKYLYIDQNSALKLATSGSSNSSRWYVEPVFPSDPTSGLYRIRNVQYNALYINNENQNVPSEDINHPSYGVRVSTIQNGDLSAIWKFCRNL